MILFIKYPSPLGVLTLACHQTALIGVWMEDARHFSMPGEAQQGTHPILTKTADWLDAYFAGEAPEVDLPLDPIGTPFQKKVWQQLLQIPYGETTTYGALAAHLDRKSSARAVGGAVGRNPISIIVPCHRVIGADGSLTGFAGGLERKKLLLSIEGIKY